MLMKFKIYYFNSPVLISIFRDIGENLIELEIIYTLIEKIK